MIKVDGEDYKNKYFVPPKKVGLINEKIMSSCRSCTSFILLKNKVYYVGDIFLLFY